MHTAQLVAQEADIIQLVDMHIFVEAQDVSKKFQHGILVRWEILCAAMRTRVNNLGDVYLFEGLA